MTDNSTKPRGWTRGSLGQCATITMGQSPSSELVNGSSDGLPFLQGNGEFGPRYPKSIQTCSKPPKIARAGDILISVRAPVGDVNFADQDYCIGRGLASVRFEEDDRLFGWYMLQEQKQYFEKVSQGSTFDAINKDNLEGLSFLNPTDRERKKIGEILNSVDGAIAVTEAVIDQTTRLKTALLQDLFSNGLPGKHSTFHDLKNYGMIPVDWHMAKIGSLFEVQLGKMLSQASRTGISPRPYLGNWNVQWGAFDFAEVKEMDFSDREYKKFQLQPGDILVCEGGDVGRTAIWNGGIENCCYQKALHRLRPRRTGTILPEFFLHFMFFAKQKQLFRRYHLTSTISHLTRETLVEIEMPFPTYKEQTMISQVLARVDRTLGQYADYLSRLDSTKKALCQALLSGEIRVKV